MLPRAPALDTSGTPPGSEWGARRGVTESTPLFNTGGLLGGVDGGAKGGSSRRERGKGEKRKGRVGKRG